jgi:carboxypeptidase T
VSARLQHGSNPAPRAQGRRLRLGRRHVGAIAACALAGALIATPAEGAPTPGLQDAKLQIVKVSTPSQAAKVRLAALPLDLTEAGGKDFVEVLLRGPKDAKLLRQNGFDYTVKIADVVQHAKQRAKADAEYAQLAASPLPSGSTAYRSLEQYNAELAALAQKYPERAKLITLKHKSLEGREIKGLEITNNVKARDGKPVMSMFGLHHAREWPSGELTLEFAYDLLQNADSDPRIGGLLDKVRLISVPMVNPDGFEKTQALPTMEYKRKNCRVLDGQTPAPGACALGTSILPIWPVETGVDPNRNYGGFWGGPGASSVPLQLTYRGAGPFSEPETQNVRELVSSNQVVTLITNHTYSNLVLRPPGLAGQSATPDEPIYKALGDQMAAQNGYTSQYSYQLYDTTGTTEDWSYHATGGLGFTFEIGPDEFHPAYAKMADFYFGEGAHAGKGNREAWLIALESTANAARHSVIQGSGPAGAVLRLHKTFDTPNNDGSTFKDTLDSTTVVPAGGSYTWHTNPSTRPLIGKQGKTETWRLTCERADGTVLQTEQVEVKRGATATVNLSQCAAAW